MLPATAYLWCLVVTEIHKVKQDNVTLLISLKNHYDPLSEVLFLITLNATLFCYAVLLGVYLKKFWFLIFTAAMTKAVGAIFISELQPYIPINSRVCLFNFQSDHAIIWFYTIIWIFFFMRFREKQCLFGVQEKNWAWKSITFLLLWSNESNTKWNQW